MTIQERIQVHKDLDSGVLSKPQFWAMCKYDIQFGIESCLFIYEPRVRPELRDMPYMLRGIQYKYVDIVKNHIDNGKPLLTEKTRDMGVTWINCAILMHYWLFENKFAAIVSSITEDKIDKTDNPDCLFWKIEYILESLKIHVPWMIPATYNDKKHRSHMHIFNPMNGSFIRGEIMGPHLGRSARGKVLLLDEFAEAKDPAASWTACSMTAPCKLVVFTPKGMNFAGRLANPSPGTPRLIDKVRLHWMQDETKNAFTIYDNATGDILLTGNGVPKPADVSALPPTASRPFYHWYEEACKILLYDPVSINQELDIGYEGSLTGQMYPQIQFSKDANVVRDIRFPLYCSLDFGVSDYCAIVWAQWNFEDNRFEWLDCFQSSGKRIQWYIPFILGEDYIALGDEEGGYHEHELEIIRRHNEYCGTYAGFFGDPAGRQRNPVTNTSVISALADFGIIVKFNIKANGYEARRTELANVLLRSTFDGKLCHKLREAITYSKMEDKSDIRNKPVHDEFSHFRTAAEFLAVGQMHIRASKINMKMLASASISKDHLATAEVIREALKKTPSEAVAINIGRNTYRVSTRNTSNMLIKIMKDEEESAASRRTMPSRLQEIHRPERKTSRLGLKRY